MYASGSIVITKSRLIGCSSATSGGGVAGGVDVTVRSSAFQRCSALGGVGGAVAAGTAGSPSTLTVDGSSFSSCVAAQVRRVLPEG